jgi:hypothetical protein
MAKHNPWMDHLKKFRAAHPGMDNKLIFTEARKTYKKGQSGGAALGGDLSPEPISGIQHTSGGAALQMEATQYSGGKSRRVKRSSAKRSGKSAKHSGSKKRSAKKRGSKRRH